jgi:RNA polymerase sigma-70 factor (ECF subfamily)
MTGNRPDSEDILQTAFLQAYAAFDRFRHESSVYTWLYRIVLNTSKKYYKESRKLPVQEYAEEHDIPQSEVYGYINRFGRSEDEVLIRRTRETCLQMFMNCMPSKYRAVYTLRTILHFSVLETAEILAIKANTVKVNLHRAKKIIQGHMEERCSLIKPGAPCDCRSYAAYLQHTQKAGLLPDMQVIREKERIATHEFFDEMAELLPIDRLFDVQLKPVDWPEFLKRVKALRQDKALKVLEY